MTLTRLIRHVPVALALSACLWPSLSRADTIATPTASVVYWTATTPGLFLGTPTYSTALALEAAMPTNAGEYIYPSGTTFTSGLNLENTDLVVQTPGGAVEAAAYQDIVDMLAAGSVNNWSGTTQTVGGIPVQTGIFSNTTAYNAANSVNFPSAYTDPQHVTGLGIAINDGVANVSGGTDPDYAYFDVDQNGNSIAVNGDSILIKFTYDGDGNLKGNVQLPDLTNALNAEQASLGGWVNGGSLYAATVQLPDLTDDLNALQDDGSNPMLIGVSGSGDWQTAQVVAVPAGQFGGAVGVPEPSSVALLLMAGLGGIGFLSTRRRTLAATCGQTRVDGQ